MDTLNLLFHGFSAAVEPANLLMLVCGISVGMIVGAIPGISAANGIALLFPVTITTEITAESAIILFSGIYYGAKYSSRISAILSGIPGDISSDTTRFDGYPLAQSGFAGKALALTALSSFTGSTIAIIVMVCMGSLFSELGSYFGPAEYVALISFVFVLIIFLSSAIFLKNLISLCLGLMVSVVGVDWSTGVFRYTATMPELFDGIDFIIFVIGIFTISEMLILIERTEIPKKIYAISDSVKNIVPDCWKIKYTYIRASIVGALIGLLPGSGAYIANFTAYRLEKRLASDKQRFGAGDLRGLIAPEAANSACAISSFIPLLALGIPGSATTAVLLGALYHINIDIGPTLYQSRPELIWALIASMCIGNVILLFINFRLIKLFPLLLIIPDWVLIPLILVVASVSVYSVHQSLVALVLMGVTGIFAYGLRKFNFPLSPLILGYVLGTPFENNLRIALVISDGSIDIFFQHGLSVALWFCVLLSVGLKIYSQWKMKNKIAL